MKIKALLFIFLFLFSGCCTLNSNIKTEKEFREIYRSSVELGTKFIKRRGVMRVASGFAIDEYRIMTAGHFCVGVHFGQNAGAEGPIEVRRVNYDYTSVILVALAEIEHVDEEMDMCVVKTYTKHNIVPMKIAYPYPRKIFDKVRIVGSPAGHFPAWEDGHIILPHYGFLPPFRMDINIAGTGGSSGSAVLNERGEVIGIIITKEEHYDHALQAVRLEDIRDFLEKNYGSKFLER